MARFFIDRPIFAWVVSLGILLAGIIALRALPIEQYPEVAPPSLTISVVYPGADAQTLEQNVTQVIAQQLNGVEGFLYMASSSASNGTASITLTFEADYSYKETGTSLPITTAVKVAGTIKGSVNPDPNHQDLAQGEIRGSRAVKATPAGGKSVLGSSRLNGSWRLQRRD